MSSNLIQQLQSVRSMSIVGMCKNAGKTDRCSTGCSPTAGAAACWG